MIEQTDVLRLFRVCFVEGRLFWRIAPRTHPRLVGREAGSLRRSASGKLYCHVKIDGKPYKRGHLIYLAANGEWPSPCLDHIDGNSLNDALSNIRRASVLENAWNHKKRSKRSDTPMGVRRLPSGRFQARLAKQNQQISVGTFATREAAIAAYRAARERYFGNFA